MPKVYKATRYPSWMLDRLKKQAEKESTTVSDLIRRAVEEYLKQEGE